MSVQKSNGPIIDPALCRCCRAIKKCRILTAEYTWMGKKEVYADMVMDCYGILLSHVDDNEKDSGVCATCVVRLREASAFRQQVLQCEELFLQAKLDPPEEEKDINYESKLKKMELEMKTEPKDYNSDHNSIDGDHDACPAYSEDDAEDNKPLKAEEPKPAEPLVLKKDEEVKSEDSEEYNEGSSSDSDEPIKKKAKRKTKAKANGAKKKTTKTAKKQKADTDTETPGLSTFIGEPIKMEFTAETSGDESLEGPIKLEFSASYSAGDSREYMEPDNYPEVPLVDGEIKKKRPWVREKEGSEYDQLCALLDTNEELYFKYFNMSKSSFDDLHDMVQELIMKEDTQMRKCVTTKERLMICLRYYRTGQSYRIISEKFGVGSATVSSVIKEVSRALWGVLQPRYMPPPRDRTWLDAETGFRETFNFPNCVGSLGGRHIVARQYQLQETDFPRLSQKACHKRLVTVALLMVTDPFNKIVALDIGNYARDGDTAVLENSKFYNKYMLKKDFLPPKPLPGDTRLVPHVLISDNSFYLRLNLMRPFPKNLASLSSADQGKRKFNKWLERAATVEKTFTLLVDCWGALDRPMDCQIETAVAIMKALCCLHNYVLAKHGSLSPCEVSDRAVNFDRPRARSRKRLKCLKPFGLAKARSTNTAMEIREQFTAYISRFESIEPDTEDLEESFQDPTVSTNDPTEFDNPFEPSVPVPSVDSNKSFDDPI